MAFALPEISRADFADGLRRLSPEPLDARAIDALYTHYKELALWNRRMSLIGPGTAQRILPRHYGESLACGPSGSTRTSGALSRAGWTRTGASSSGWVSTIPSCPWI